MTNIYLCKICKEPIDENAKICYQCSSYQNRYLRFYKTYETTIIIVISVIALWFTYDQLKQAEIERTTATEAKTLAQTALNSNEDLYRKSDSLYQ